MEREYLQVGKKATIDGEDWYSRDYHSDGGCFGNFYKSEKAFRENPDEICYIPEYGFTNEPCTDNYKPETKEIDGELFYNKNDISGYTRRDLEALVEDEVDCEGDPIDVEWFFSELLWMFPETRLEEIAC